MADDELQVMLEPWCLVVDVPSGQWAKLSAIFNDDSDEYHLQYFSNVAVSVYCPPDTTLELVEKR